MKGGGILNTPVVTVLPELSETFLYLTGINELGDENVQKTQKS